MLRHIKRGFLLFTTCFTVSFIIGVITELRRNPMARKAIIKAYKQLTGSKQASKPVVRLSQIRKDIRVDLLTKAAKLEYVRDYEGYIVVTECFACEQPCSKRVVGPSFCSDYCEKRYEDDMIASMEGEMRAERAAERYFEEGNRFGGWDLDD